MVRRAFKKYGAIFMAGGLLFVSGYASALTPLSVQELNQLCKNYSSAPSQADSVQCARYIKGFIDGVKSVKPSVANKESVDGEKSKFTQRAIATRVGSRTGHYFKEKNEPFCLGQNYSLKAVVDNVATEIKTINIKKSALLAVNNALRKNYPCS